MSECKGIQVSLCLARVGREAEPCICSRHRFKLEGTCDSGWLAISVSLAPVGVPVMLGLGKDVIVSVVILNVSELQ